MRRRSIWSYLSLLMIAGLIASACTGTPGTTTASPGGAATDPNGELFTNTGAEPATIDPQKESFVNEVAHTMMVFEALMTFDPKTLKAIPAAAKENPKLSADGLTYTYTLRDGLKYSDGSPVTAKDFAYGFTRVCDPATAGEYAYVLTPILVGCDAFYSMDPKTATKAELDAAKAKVGIKVNGDKEISFTLTEKAPYFNSIAALWVGVPTRESDVAKGGDKWTDPPTFIGNGPFKLTEWKHNEKMVFERNDNYRTPTKIKRWTKQMINESSVAFAAYQNNELDMVGVGAEQLRTIEGNADLKAQTVDVGGSCTIYVGFNNSKPPFDDQKVRMAFAKSYDKQAYINDVAKIGKAADSGGFIPPGMPGYDKDDTAQKFDPTAAKALLAQSKYANTDALKNIKFTYSASAASKTRIEWLQQQWQTNLGITVSPDPVDATTYTSLVKNAATVPTLFRLGWCADYPDPQDWLTLVFHSSSTVTRVGYKNPEYDKLVRQADADPNPESRDKTYQQASRMLSNDAPAGWWYYSATKYLRKPWVKGITDTVMDFEYGIFDLTAIAVTAKK